MIRTAQSKQILYGSQEGTAFEQVQAVRSWMPLPEVVALRDQIKGGSWLRTENVLGEGLQIEAMIVPIFNVMITVSRELIT